MTNEEAIEQLKQLKAFTGFDKDNTLVQRLHEALDMAIEALEDKGYEQGYNDGYTEAMRDVAGEVK